jgi:hypothetical protein
MLMKISVISFIAGVASLGWALAHPAGALSFETGRVLFFAGLLAAIATFAAALIPWPLPWLRR